MVKSGPDNDIFIFSLIDYSQKNLGNVPSHLTRINTLVKKHAANFQ